MFKIRENIDRRKLLEISLTMPRLSSCSPSTSHDYRLDGLVGSKAQQFSRNSMTHNIQTNLSQTRPSGRVGVCVMAFIFHNTETESTETVNNASRHL